MVPDLAENLPNITAFHFCGQHSPKVLIAVNFHLISELIFLSGFIFLYLIHFYYLPVFLFHKKKSKFILYVFGSSFELRVPRKLTTLSIHTVFTCVKMKYLPLKSGLSSQNVARNKWMINSTMNPKTKRIHIRYFGCGCHKSKH